MVLPANPFHRLQYRVPIGTNMGERFIFMPSFGFCLFVGMGLYAIIEKRPAIRKNVGYVGIVILALLAGKTVVRNLVWKDNYTLFTSDVKISPNSAKLQTPWAARRSNTLPN
ncbi:MAG: hypothetical protein IPJ00_08180 [Saprospirales bacterium]|nr:hypothetical protein [Saprospirales bacterium]